MAVGEAAKELEQEQLHVAGVEAAGILLQILGKVSVLKGRKLCINQHNRHTHNQSINAPTFHPNLKSALD